MAGTETMPTTSTPSTMPVERIVFFTDAVVAIAQTLLILPLVESVGEATSNGLDTSQWLNEQGSHLWAFVLSFAVISAFWLNHHRTFAGVERADTPLWLLNSGWMFTIVWLAVATALIGSTDTPDRLTFGLYIGTLLVTNVFISLIAWRLVDHPELSSDEARPRRNLVVAVVLTVFFGFALAFALAFPSVGWWGMVLVSGATPVIGWALRRWAPDPRPDAGEPTPA